MTKINTGKRHILELYRKNVAAYDSNRSRHSQRRNSTADAYRKALESCSLVIKDLDNDGRRFVMMLMCGKSPVTPTTWRMDEIPYCLESEVTE